MSNQLSVHVAAVMRLLLEEGHDSAVRYLDQNLTPEIEKVRRDLDALQKEYTKIRSLVEMTRPEGDDVGTFAKPQLQGASDFKLSGDPDDARAKVLRIAAEVARANGGIARLDDVLAAMKEQGVELEKSTRPGTSVANILFKANVLWERIDSGVFRLIG